MVAPPENNRGIWEFTRARALGLPVELATGDKLDWWPTAPREYAKGSVEYERGERHQKQGKTR